jgi:hypothetical protein
MGTACGSRRERRPLPGDEIVEAPVIARRRSDRCEGSALLRSQLDAHDAEKLVEPSPLLVVPVFDHADLAPKI